MRSKINIVRLGLYGCLVLTVIAAGCAPVYVPSARHTHQLNEKGEASFSGHSGTNGADFQLAYAVTDHIGVLGAASFARDDEREDQDFHKHTYGEIGVQYHDNIGGIGRFEFLSGFGRGSASSVDTYTFDDSPSEIRATGKYGKFFVQPNIGLETDIVDAGLAFRFGHVIFTEFETSNATYNENESATFFEPGLFVRRGWQTVKLEGQIGYSVPMQDENQVAFDYEPFFLSLGIQLKLDDLLANQ